MKNLLSLSLHNLFPFLFLVLIINQLTNTNSHNQANNTILLFFLKHRRRKPLHKKLLTHSKKQIEVSFSIEERSKRRTVPSELSGFDRIVPAASWFHIILEWLASSFLHAAWADHLVVLINRHALALEWYRLTTHRVTNHSTIRKERELWVLVKQTLVMTIVERSVDDPGEIVRSVFEQLVHSVIN